MKIPLLLFLFYFAALKIFAQPPQDLQTPCSATSQGQVGNFNVSYTIGEMVLVDTYKSGNLILTQGIIQPFTSIADNNGYGIFTADEVKVYPNPTPDLLSVHLALLRPGKFDMELYDMQGKTLLQDNISYNGFSVTQYNIKQYAAGAYILQVTYQDNIGADKRRGTYSIIKLN